MLGLRPNFYDKFMTGSSFRGLFHNTLIQLGGLSSPTKQQSWSGSTVGTTNLQLPSFYEKLSPYSMMFSTSQFGTFIKKPCFFVGLKTLGTFNFTMSFFPKTAPVIFEAQPELPVPGVSAELGGRFGSSCWRHHQCIFRKMLGKTLWVAFISNHIFF